MFCQIDAIVQRRVLLGFSRHSGTFSYRVKRQALYTILPDFRSGNIEAIFQAAIDLDRESLKCIAATFTDEKLRFAVMRQFTD